jgi:hypothetical protein
MLAPSIVLGSAPLWVVSLVVNEPAALVDGRSFVVVTLISMAGFAVMATIMLLTDALLSRRPLPTVRESVVVVVVIVVAAEARTAVMLAGFAAASLPDDVPTVYRVLGSPLLALVAFGYAGLALSSWRRFRDERDRLLVSLALSRERIEAHEATVDTMGSVLRETVQGRLLEARSDIDRQLDALSAALERGQDGRPELDQLRSATDERWRQISKEVWREIHHGVPRAGLREFAWAYALTRPFPLLGLLGGATAMVFFVFARTLPLGEALESVIVWLAVTAAIAATASAAARRWPGQALPVVIAAIVLMLLFPVWLVALGIVDPSNLGLVFRITVINAHVVAVLVIAGASGAVARNREAVLAALRRRRERLSLAQLQVESRLLAVAQEVAATLHGDARSAFMASALRLEAALDSGDRSAARALIEELRAVVTGTEQGFTQPAPKVERQHLQEVVDAWQSVCDIAVVGEWSAIPEVLLPAARTVLVEGIADALRHGDCSRVDIRIAATADSVEISLTNDGLPLAASSAAPGLGSAMLDSVAPGSWSRGIGPHGHTALSVVLRC